MKNKTGLNLGIAIMVFTFMFYSALWVLNSTRKAESSSPQGTMTLVASSTKKSTVGSTSPVTLFSRNDGCTSRIITTYSKPIMLTFATSTDLDETVEPTGQFGHLQGASTTVSYDSGIYGCGVWQAYGFEFSSSIPSTTISISEFSSWR